MASVDEKDAANISENKVIDMHYACCIATKWEVFLNRTKVVYCIFSRKYQTSNVYRLIWMV